MDKKLRKKIIIGSFIFDIVVIAGILCYFLFSEPTINTGIPGQGTIKVSQIAAFSSEQQKAVITQGVQQKIETFRRQEAARINQTYTPNAKPGVITLSDQEANAYLQSLIATDPAIKAKLESSGVNNPVIHFADGKVVAFGHVNQKGFSFPITLTAKLAGQQGNILNFVVESIDVGKIGVPGFIQDSIKSKLAQNSSQMQVTLPPEISQIQFQNGKLVIIGK